MSPPLLVLNTLRNRILRECNIRGYKHGAAVLDRSGNIRAIGINVRGAGYSSRLSYHAEEMALIRAARKGGVPRHATLVVARLNKDGTWGLSKPCNRCEYLIHEAGIKVVEYTS